MQSRTVHKVSTNIKLAVCSAAATRYEYLLGAIVSSLGFGALARSHCTQYSVQPAV